MVLPFEIIERKTIEALAELIRRQKGGCLTFTCKHLARLAGLDTKPVTLTLIREVIEELRRRGWLEIYKISSHGIKYKITCKSPAWKILKTTVPTSLNELLMLAEALATI